METKGKSGSPMRPALLRSAFSLTLAAALLLGQAARAENPSAVAMPGQPVFAYGSYDLGTQGYQIKEFSLAGTAISYALDNSTGGKGIVPATVAGHAPYKTRIVVITPINPAKFNGTVVVEWLNVTAGQDAPADFVMMHRELFREGYAYVGVSAQKAGIDGGASIQVLPPLKKTDPARYGALQHPGDAYCFDIFSDTARLLKSQPAGILGSLRPKHVIAMGDSQSAMYLATYVNEVDPLVKLYDGFLIHSRPGFVPPLDGRSIFTMPLPALQTATPLLADPRVPVVQLITETDLVGLGEIVGLYPVQQADSAHLRTWEITGAAHVDNYQLLAGRIDVPQLPVAKLAAAWAPMQTVMGTTLPQPINNGPQQHYVAEAALAGLNDWIATGKAPPSAGDIVLGSASAKGGLDGGVRTPWVEVPDTRLTGFPVTVMGIAGVGGSSVPYAPAALAQFYPGGKAEYLRKFQAALDKTIQAGFILPADRTEILELAGLSYPQNAPAAAPP